MIRFSIKLAISVFTLCCVAYVFFMVPLGERTLFQHCVRIAGTDEARELGREVGEAGTRVVDEIGDQIEQENERGSRNGRSSQGKSRARNPKEMGPPTQK